MQNITQKYLNDLEDYAVDGLISLDTAQSLLQKFEVAMLEELRKDKTKLYYNLNKGA